AGDARPPYPSEPTPPPSREREPPAVQELRPQPPDDAPPVRDSVPDATPPDPLPHSRSAKTERPVLRALAVRRMSSCPRGICSRKLDALPASSSPFRRRCSAYESTKASSARVIPT